MSGTGPTPAEQHLGDRLAALVDGELKHDARERVLAHLATCGRCKAEAAAQRRLKSVFAQSAPPSPSEGFLARLQGLPGGPGGDDDGRGGRTGGPGRFADGFLPVMQPFDARAGSPSDGSPPRGLGHLPTSHGPAAALAGGADRSAFRSHEVGREAERSPWRGRRFAFAAASAVSLAAIALGGTLPTDSGPDTPARAEGVGNNVTPLDASARAGSGAGVSRRGGVNSGTPAAAPGTAPSAPGGVPTTPAAPRHVPATGLSLFSAAPALLATGGFVGSRYGVPLLSGVSAPPLIRPNGTQLLAPASGGGQPSAAAAPSPAPSWTAASALPAPADHGLPLSRRH